MVYHSKIRIDSQPINTIAAVATPSGRGGVSIIRVSGPKVVEIAEAVLKKIPTPRHATHSPFYDENGQPLDEGLAFYFPKPHSFTGEDVLEFHGHGGPVVVDCLLRRILHLGAQIARPGEFSERAFLNDKLDLTQAEAIADLIDATTEHAARAAMRSLQGEFSDKIQAIVERLIHLRMYIEAAIDFPEEEIDFLNDHKVTDKLSEIVGELENIKGVAQRGVLLREGWTVVIAGRPNAGKSSLLNCLSGRNSAIVTDIPGTTRDVLREHIHIDGVPLHIIDTAGLRESSDPIEQEGIRRAWVEIDKADHVLLIVDGQQISSEQMPEVIQETLKQLPQKITVTVVRNKIDLTKELPRVYQCEGVSVVTLSAKTGGGVDLLCSHLKTSMGQQGSFEGEFIARRRHLEALDSAYKVLLEGQNQLDKHRASELLAEDLRQAQRMLSEITGEFTSDDLLGKIFSTFCVGK